MEYMVHIILGFKLKLKKNPLKCFEIHNTKIRRHLQDIFVFLGFWSVVQTLVALIITKMKLFAKVNQPRVKK